MQNLNIVISKEANDKLKQLIEENPTYSCIRIDYSPSCGNNHVQLYLDELQNQYVIEKIHDIFFIYKEFICHYISSVNIIYENSQFMLKITPTNKVKNKCKSCNGCNKDCNKNCHSGCCNKKSTKI